MYLFLVLGSLLFLFLASRIDKSYSKDAGILDNGSTTKIRRNPYDMRDTGREVPTPEFDTWIEFYNRGRSRIYIIVGLVSLIPFVNYATFFLTGLLLVVYTVAFAFYKFKL